MGHGGADTFVFTTADQDRDRISDFNATKGDIIQVSASSFGGNLTVGSLEAEYFVLGGRAIDSNDRFIYNQNTGVLSFDVDGSGTLDAVEIATLSNKVLLNHTDISIV